MKCEECGGTGKVQKWFYERTGFGKCEKVCGDVKCEWCNGTGEVEQTNEEWFDGLSTEEKAEFISKIDMPFMDKTPFPCGDLIECSKNCGLYSRCVKDDFPTNKEVWVEWLKQPHTVKE